MINYKFLICIHDSKNILNLTLRPFSIPAFLGTQADRLESISNARTLKQAIAYLCVECLINQVCIFHLISIV